MFLQMNGLPSPLLVDKDSNHEEIAIFCGSGKK